MSDQLSDAVGGLWDRVKDRLADAVISYNDARADRDVHDYFPPSDQPPHGGRVIRLDIAIMACHMLAAKHAFRTVPNLQKLIVNQLLAWLGGKPKQMLENYVQEEIPRGAPVIKAMEAILKLMQDEQIQRGVELRIRANSVAMMKEIAGDCLKSRPSEPRKTKEVLSRHASPTQRKKNKSWRAPK